MFSKVIHKWYYGGVILLPLLFLYLYKTDHKKRKEAEAFQFYTSVKSEQISSIDFYTGESFLFTWNGPFNAYKQIDFYEQKRSMNENSFRLKLQHSGVNDTIRFLGLSFLIDENIYSLSPDQFNLLRLSENAEILNTKDQLILVSKDGADIWIDLKSPLNWQSDSISTTKKTIWFCVALLFLIAVLYFKPSTKHFAFALSISVILFFYLWYLGKDASAQISITDFKPQQSARFYYNEIPDFKPSLSVEFNDTNDIRRTQAYPNQYPFYRIDLQDSLRSLANTKIKYHMGLFSCKWDFSQLKPFQVNGNGLDYSDHTFYSTTNDPYLCLTSADFTKKIKLLDFLRYSLFLIFSVAIFGLTLFFTAKTKQTSNPYYVLSYVVLAMCFFTPLFHVFDAKRLILSEEKRLAYPIPVYNKNIPVKEYTKQLENYMKDQLPGRGPLIISNNLFKYKVFSELATNPMVYFGKENWMFYIGENVKEIYENKRLYTEEELKKMTRHLEERRDWLNAQGISYYILFPRMSHYFYQEKVGAGLYQYIKKPRLEQFVEYLNTHSTVKVIDVSAPMFKAKQAYSRDLYYRSDSHWNLFGAYFAYEAVINYIQKDYPAIKPAIPLKEIKWIEDESQEADLSKLISLSGHITRHEYLPLHKDVNSSELLPSPDYPEYQSVHPLVVYQGKDSTAPRMVMNRDSYSNFLIPYFSKHFSRQTYIWSPLFFSSIIEKEKPDIVITEMMERFVNDLLIENPPLQINKGAPKKTN